MISHEELTRRLSYDPLTGLFTWNTREVISRLDKTWNARYAGKPAGSLHKKGYIYINLDGIKLFAHKLAVYYVTGIYPHVIIDHVDLDRANNKYINLREANASESSANRRGWHNKSIPWKGVYAVGNRYRALVDFYGKRVNLGYFDCPAAASLSYQVAADKLQQQFSRAY